MEPLTGKGAAADWFAFKQPKSGKGRAIDLDAETTVRRLKAHKSEQSARRLAIRAEIAEKMRGSSEEAVQAAQEQAWRDLDLIFTNAAGEPLRPSTASTAFTQRAAAAGFKGLRFHDLRHTHATLLLKAGKPPHVVSRRLGHSDVAFTLRVYAEVLPSQARDAADAFAGLMQGTEKAV